MAGAGRDGETAGRAIPGEHTMLDDEEHFRLLGTRSREDAGRRLAAGPLEAMLIEGNLRFIRFLGHEVLRAVAFLVRDRDWGTCAPDISDLTVKEGPDHFTVAYRSRFRAPSGAELATEARIVGRTSGRLDFVTRSLADANFETARAGFTVLHPLRGVVGQPVEVMHTDGTMESSHWPDLIAPWQPFKDIRTIRHGVAPGIKATTQFTGDIFEMEDQRNWTDASFKTYVRPLALPWPYTVAPGAPMEQSVRVELACDETALPAEPRSAVLVVRREPTAALLPAIGVGLRPECQDTDLPAVDVLKMIGAGHLVAHFDPLAGHGSRDLLAYACLKRAAPLPLTLELALPCRQKSADELKEIAEACHAAGLDIDDLFVCPSVDRQSTPPGSRWPSCPPLEEIYAGARAAFPGVRIGGGMMSYFTELNRKRVPDGRLDYISHTTNPVVHAADDVSIMQTFEALRDVVRSVRAIYPSRHYRIGPSTIAMRQNPYGAATKNNPDGIRIPMASVDPRHNGDFGATWALVYAATVANARLELLTLSTLTGPFGVIAGDNEPTAAGELRPIGRVIAELGKLAGQSGWQLRCDRPGTLVGLGNGERLLIANLTADAVTMRPQWSFSTVRSLCHDDVAQSAGETIELRPYESVAVV